MPRRLSEETKAAIIADYGAGMTVVRIAAKHGVATTYPSTLVSRLNLPMRWPVERRRRMSEGASGR